MQPETGIIVPLIKAVSHLAVALVESNRDPMDEALIQAELTGAREHINNLNNSCAGYGLTIPLAHQITAFTSTLTGHQEPNKLISVVNAAWALAADIEEELTGFRAEPGDQP